jgi:inosine/xanthosine triphosphate pyrophosphatase family protein
MPSAYIVYREENLSVLNLGKTNGKIVEPRGNRQFGLDAYFYK